MLPQKVDSFTPVHYRLGKTLQRDVKDLIIPSSKVHLARASEQLVLEGYRGWTWAVSSKCSGPWEHVCSLYAEEIPGSAHEVLEALDAFASALGTCASGPLRMLQRGCAAICREEALVLALVSAIQISDDATIDLCLASLCRRETVPKVALAAGIYSIMLRGAGFCLQPVPASVVLDIEAQARAARSGVPAGATIH
jgi:hypothetical protein